jgi:hypothetical protein
VGIFTRQDQFVEAGTVVGLQEKFLWPAGIGDIPSRLADMEDGDEDLIRQALSQSLPNKRSDAHFVCRDGNQWIPIVEHLVDDAMVVGSRFGELKGIPVCPQKRPMEIGIALEFLAERVEPVPELLQSCFGGQATVSIVRGLTELNREIFAHAIELSMPAPA